MYQLEIMFIGIGATIRDNIKIGENSIIGAHTNITKDVKSDTLVYGNPVEKFLNYYNYYVSSTFLPDESNIIDFLEIFSEKGIKISNWGQIIYFVKIYIIMTL